MECDGPTIAPAQPCNRKGHGAIIAFCGMCSRYDHRPDGSTDNHHVYPMRIHPDAHLANRICRNAAMPGELRQSPFPIFS